MSSVRLCTPLSRALAPWAGQLGQISRPPMSKSVTDAAFGLMVKEITRAPVETAFGFHIIERTE